MGSQATVVVRTDRLSEIEADPDFGRKLVAAIRAKGGGPDGDADPPVTGQTRVVCVTHSGSTTLLRAGGNTGRVLAHFPVGIPDEALLCFAIEILSEAKLQRLQGAADEHR